MRTDPIRFGVLQAGLAALLFGLTAPLVQRAATGTGALASGALLYVGAAVVAAARLAARRAPAEAPLGHRQIAPLLGVALIGGLVAPALLVLGLQKTNAASGALLLALEAPLTILLARLVYAEHIGRRTLAAASLILGGAALASWHRPSDGLSFQGALLVGAATLAWSIDNIITRALADRDPLLVIAGKGGIGGLAAVLAAFVLGEEWPTPPRAAGLLAAGALGFGLSLLLYLRAQRIMGAARTASVFSAAPFLGAASALVLGTPWPGWSFAVAACLIAGGVWLHASESHAHEHEHTEIEHEHAHSHDDGHHDHRHDPMPVGPHSHRHHHDRIVHSHAHGDDVHHRHVHS